MPYLVELTVRAARDLSYLYEQISAAESTAAARWYNGIENAMQTPERFPRRCPAAPESRKARRPLRQLPYGRKPHLYRVIYEIDETSSVVRVLTIRHGAMADARF